MTPLTYRGRTERERDYVLVPEDIRHAILAIWPGKAAATEALGIGNATYYALIEVGGQVRSRVLARVRERIHLGPPPPWSSSADRRDWADLDKGDLRREGG